MKGKPVLILDVHGEVAEALADFLVRDGYEVIRARSLDIVPAELETARFSMVFMGARPGREDFIESLKQVSPETLCFAVRPKTGVDPIAGPVSTRADGVLTFPLSKDELAALLKRASERREKTPDEKQALYPQSPARPVTSFVVDDSGFIRLSAEGRILWGTDELPAFLGYSVSELRQKYISDIAHPRDRSDLAESLSRLVENKTGPVFPKRIRLAHKNGSVVLAELVNEGFFVKINFLKESIDEAS